MRVPLPDGSVRELPDGSTGADLAADIGPGLARAAMAIRVLDGDRTEKRDGTAYDDGPDRRPVAAAGRRRSRSRSSPPRPATATRSKLLRHDVAHVLAESVLELYPGHEGVDRPADRRRLLLRLRVPARRHGQRGRLRAHRGPDAQAHQGRRAVRALARSRRPRRSSATCEEDQPYKVELIEDLVTRPGRRDRQPLPQRRVPRPLPRPARARHRPREGVQAHERRRRLLARRREPPRCSPASTAPRSRPRTSWPSTSSGSSRRAPATTASSARSSSCSCSPSSHRARRSGSRTGWRSGTS